MADDWRLTVEFDDAAAQRSGARANPRPASPPEIAKLYRSVW